MYLNSSIFTVFLKNRNIVFKMKKSKLTDYAALKEDCHIIFKSDRYKSSFCLLTKQRQKN